jgi:hypothetical protein
MIIKNRIPKKEGKSTNQRLSPPLQHQTLAVLEHVYDCMCMCVATVKVMNVIESFRSGKGCRVKEVN